MCYWNHLWKTEKLRTSVSPKPTMEKIETWHMARTLHGEAVWFFVISTVKWYPSDISTRRTLHQKNLKFLEHHLNNSPFLQLFSPDEQGLAFCGFDASMVPFLRQCFMAGCPSWRQPWSPLTTHRDMVHRFITGAYTGTSTLVLISSTSEGWQAESTPWC